MASLRKRGSIYYIQYYIGSKQRRTSTETYSLQPAKEKLGKFKSAQAQDIDNPFPTRTPIAEVALAYVEHIRTTKTLKSTQTDIYYLRQIFGVVCPSLEIVSRRIGPRRPRLQIIEKLDRRRRAPTLEASCFEQITTADIAAFITKQVQSRGLAPKTANRYREILVRLFNWAMEQHGIRMPHDKNPAAKVDRYKERAGQIRYLTLPQIDEQLHALRFKPKLQTMVAMPIFAGLRREELLWLRTDDVDFNTHHEGCGVVRVRAKTIDGESWQPKTKVNRAIPISKVLRT
jgi:integrase